MNANERESVSTRIGGCFHYNPQLHRSKSIEVGGEKNPEGIKYRRQSASEVLRYEAAKPRLQGFITALSQLALNVKN